MSVALRWPLRECSSRSVRNVPHLEQIARAPGCTLLCATPLALKQVYLRFVTSGALGEGCSVIRAAVQRLRSDGLLLLDEADSIFRSPSHSCSVGEAEKPLPHRDERVDIALVLVDALWLSKEPSELHFLQAFRIGVTQELQERMAQVLQQAERANAVLRMRLVKKDYYKEHLLPVLADYLTHFLLGCLPRNAVAKVQTRRSSGNMSDRTGFHHRRNTSVPSLETPKSSACSRERPRKERQNGSLETPKSSVCSRDRPRKGRPKAKPHVLIEFLVMSSEASK